MSDFQLIMTAQQTGNGQRLIVFTIGASYIQGAQTYYNVTGSDSGGNNYTGLMTRTKRGEFMVRNLTLVTP